MLAWLAGPRPLLALPPATASDVTSVSPASAASVRLPTIADVPSSQRVSLNVPSLVLTRHRRLRDAPPSTSYSAIREICQSTGRAASDCMSCGMFERRWLRGRRENQRSFRNKRGREDKHIVDTVGRRVANGWNATPTGRVGSGVRLAGEPNHHHSLRNTRGLRCCPARRDPRGLAQRQCLAS